MSALLDKILDFNDKEIAKIINDMSADEAKHFYYDWSLYARDEQVAPPGNWRFWMFLGGRGSGKTRAGAEWIIEKARKNPKERIGLIAPTAADVRDTMLEGPSGILTISPPWFMPKHFASKQKLVWPNGASALTRSADQPERIRGPNFSTVWMDELRAWRRIEAYDMVNFALRIGSHPQACVTTTSRPLPVIKDLISRDGDDVVLTKGSTYRNRLNLAPDFFREMKKKYEGTRLGRQELYAEILDDIEGALWTWDLIEQCRVKESPDMMRVVIGVDPAGSHTDNSDETGIVVCGKGVDGEYYTLEDLSCRLSPNGWASRVAYAYHRGWGKNNLKPSAVIAEVNKGGNLVKSTIHTIDRDIKVIEVHTCVGKVVRAEPVAALAEQTREHHVGLFPEMEDQMTITDHEMYQGEGSPDRMDAKVYAITELMDKKDFKRVNFSITGGVR